MVGWLKHLRMVRSLNTPLLGFIQKSTSNPYNFVLGKPLVSDDNAKDTCCSVIEVESFSMEGSGVQIPKQ